MAAKSIGELRTNQQNRSEGFNLWMKEMQVRVDQSIESRLQNVENHMLKIEDQLDSLKLMLQNYMEGKGLGSLLPNPVNSAPSTAKQIQDLGDVDYNSAISEESSIEEAGDVDKLLESEANGFYDGKIVSPNTGRGVFDELSQPIFIATAGYKLIEKGLDADSLQNSQVTLKLAKSIELVFTGSKSFPGKFYSISTIENVEISSLKTGVQLMQKAEELFPSKKEVGKGAYQVFDNMLKPSLAEQNDGMGSQLSLPTIGLLKMLGCDFIDSNGVKQDLDKMPNSSTVKLWIAEVLLFIFDPGGNSFIILSCEPFESTGDKQNLGEFSENRDQYSLGRIWEVILEEFMLNLVGTGLKPRDLDDDNMISGANKLEMPWALAVCAEIGGQDKNCEEIEVFVNANCHAMESNNEEQDLDKLMRIIVDSHCTIFRLKAWPKVAIVLGLVPLMSIHWTQSAIHLIPVVFCIDDHKFIWITLKQLAANFMFSLVALWDFGCLHLADAVNANVLNVELWFEFYKAFQIEIQAAFCIVTSWIGSGSSTTISTGVRLVPLITLALGGKNWLTSNPAYFHLTQEHIPTAFWGTLVDWCQYGRVSCRLFGVCQGQDDRVGNIIPTAKAGGAAILYDWDAQNVYIKRGSILPKPAITDSLVELLNLQQYSVGDHSGKMINVRVFSFAVLSGKSNTRIGVVLAHDVAAVAILGLISCVIHRHKMRVGGNGKKIEGSLVAIGFKGLQSSTKFFFRTSWEEEVLDQFSKGLG